MKTPKLGRALALPLLGLLAACDGLTRCSPPDPLSAEAFDQRYADPLTPPLHGLRVFHLGHSLVGRDMPAMVEQLATAAGIAGHDHASQLGWGTSLRQHWEPREAIAGFETENDHPRFRPAREALGSGTYDAVVLTEMVELRDAIRWHDSPDYLHRWARAGGNARIYLYETWHHLDDPAGWLNRLDHDASQLWEGTLLAGAMAYPDTPTIHVIPAGRVMAAVARALDSGGVPGLDSPEALFARSPEGVLDTIHVSDLGAYLVALTHVAVLYHVRVTGLPHDLLRADGAPVDAISPEAAALIQRSVDAVVRALPVTGTRG